MGNACFKISCVLFFLVFISLLSCYKKDNIFSSPGNGGDLSVENAKAYFTRHFKENAPLATRTFKNMPADAREAFSTIENNKTVLWDQAYTYITSARRKTVKVPLDFGNAYYKVNGSVVPYSSLNYLFMYIDSIGSIRTEWVTLLPDTAWLQGKRDSYKGNILVRDWNGAFIKYLQFPATPLSRNARTGDPRIPICIDIQNPQKCTCWDKSNCDLCPQCVDTYCTWPPIDPPEDPPFDPGQPSGGNGPGSNNPSPGGPVGGNPSDGDYPPNCNADPNYTVPTTPPPAGQEWALPCGSIPQPVEEGTGDEDAIENTFAVDCQTFAFTKTSTANWQEAGVNKIRLKWVWSAGGNGRPIAREIYINHIVFGLPQSYINGKTLSPGQAAVLCAKIVDEIKIVTYREFRTSPNWPDENTIIAFFKTKLSDRMTQEYGTAGTTGSGSPSIIFRDEDRSNFSDPYDCQ